MSIHVALSHTTHYHYDRLVKLGAQVVRLRPAPHSRTRVLSYSLRVEPLDHFINWQQDPFANYQARLVFPEAMREFKVTVDLVVEMAVFNPFDFFLEPEAEQFPFTYSAAQARELAPYLATLPLTPLFKSYLDKVDRQPKPTIDFLVALNQRLQADIQYEIRMEPGVQTPEETLGLARGSCRDSGWLLVQLLRHMGLAARFVSGYLIQLKADVKSLDGPSGAAADFTDLHAWCEVFLPGAGWVGLDPTSGLMAGEGHIPLACTPEPSSAAPIEGIVDACEVKFSHHMGVQRIHESPRVTQPYTDAQWQAILTLGEVVDQDLAAGDVRLTMGGEPTFVATSNRDAPEWNIDALGPTKRDYAAQLLKKLYARYGQGGFWHYGQSKWYPGEQLPRWALSLFWRQDDQPLWQNPDLLADEQQHAHYSSADAQRFISTLAGKLGVAQANIIPGYEDSGYYQWRESRLPVNVEPRNAKLTDALERERLRRVWTQGVEAVVGYALPLQAPQAHSTPGEMAAWRSSRWFFRTPQMYLLAGDSPMGYRLPLDAMPWIAPENQVDWIETDPFAPREPLPAATRLAAPYQTDLRQVPAANTPPETPPSLGQSAVELVRTALCVEVRDPARAQGPLAQPRSDKDQGVTTPNSGALYVFMPPMERLEDYLNLLAAVEATAQALGVRIVLEGYTPPRDPRLNMLQVTPDPGVIEVNIQPVSSWHALVANTEFLYQVAHETRLSAEKFMTDGRHTGTGGGNHLVLGGATPADSPFLRRPELLASLLAYWHNHPSLSYLFSGLFVGPTSQAPRVDEARNDQLYELEIALREISRSREKHGAHMPPWVVDRTLRNILVDVTGNTHRSEFCIDKMYSPDSSTGRLGLLELRAFEMPPHARMSVAQQLLLRALVARFWHTPLPEQRLTLTRWGTALHDRFMLPHFIRADFADVLQALEAAGYPFDLAWFEPHLEFRFPLIGELQVQGIQLSLRTALEPWHVMGEESRAGGTARYVDSSLERLEVQVQGLNNARYVVTVNGHALPLHSTGRAGEYVAGVRYKAWNPPSALHPSIGVHAPLTFDVVDTWTERSVGGCQYHVTHPGGRSYDTLPINSYEAESRRLNRFFRMGHSPGKLQVMPVQHSLEFPLTLDLRSVSTIPGFGVN